MSCMEECSAVTIEVMKGQLVVKMRSSSQFWEDTGSCCLALSGNRSFSKIQQLVTTAQGVEPGTARGGCQWNIRTQMSFKAVMAGEVAPGQTGEIRVFRKERSKGRREGENWAENPADESNDTFSVHCRILKAEDRMYFTSEIYRVKG